MPQGGPFTSDVSSASHMPFTEEGPAGCPSCGANGNIWGDCEHERPYRVWGSVDYLLWRIKDTGVPQFNAGFGGGFLFVPITNTIINVPPGGGAATLQTFTQTPTIPAAFSVSSSQGGTNTVSFGDQPGMRYNLGYWFDSEDSVGIEASYFSLWRRTNNFNSSQGASNQSIPLGSQFTDNQLIQTTTVVNGTATTTILSNITLPVFIAANTNVNLSGQISSETWGTEFNGRCRVCSFGCLKIDAIGGFRYLDIDERLSTREDITLTSIPSTNGVTTNGTGSLTSTTNALVNPFNNAFNLPGTTTFSGVIYDLIDVHSRFYGAQAGFDFDWRVIGNVYLSGFTKIAVGDMRETYSLRGLTQQIFPPAPGGLAPGIVTTAGGQFVNPQDNNTTRHYDRTCIVPQVNLNLGYELTDNIRVHVGYDYLYISALSRPIEQLTVAPGSVSATFGSNATGGTTAQNVQIFSPAFKAKTDQAWLYGLNMGVDIRY